MSKSNCVCRTPTDYKKAILKDIESLSGSRSQYDVFYDWVECSAISIQSSLMVFANKDQEKVKIEREKDFERIISQYDDGASIFGSMLGKLTMAMEYEMSDILGEIYMECGMGNKSTGQFFTPFSVSSVLSRLVFKESENDTDDVITLNEPSCGSGGMIIAAASELKDRGINYQKKLKVVAQDLDWKAVYMCYVQLSLYGINAVVVQGSTLSEPYPYLSETDAMKRVWYTPCNMGLLI